MSLKRRRLRVSAEYFAHYKMEVGLVDWPLGAKPDTPTLFVAAYCKSEKDRRWFRRQVRELLRMSGERDAVRKK